MQKNILNFWGRPTSYRLMTARFLGLLLLVGLFAAGCATSTVEKRRNERQAAYDKLSPDMKQFADQGRIKVGMPMDAVYIAWGKPAQVVQNETAAGSAVIWLYEGAWLETNPVWAQRGMGAGRHFHTESYVAYGYTPRTYVSAEIVFVGGVVKEWRTLPQPPS
jgi:hypothetical protein